MDALDKAGLIHHPQTGKWPGLKRYAAADNGNPPQSLILSPTGFTNYTKGMGEYIGYPTQKPLGLLEPMILASCPTDGLVLDPFCGCGTAADAAAKLGRKYLGIDVSAIAVRVMEQRLTSRGGKTIPTVYKMDWEDYEWETFERRALMKEADAEDGLPGWAWAEDKVAGLLSAAPNSQKIGDGGVDARYYTEKGGVIPIQVKMHKGQIGRPELQNLLGVQTEWQNKGSDAPNTREGDAIPAQGGSAGVCGATRAGEGAGGRIPEDAGVERPGDADQAGAAQATAGGPALLRGGYADSLGDSAVIGQTGVWLKFGNHILDSPKEG